MSKLDFDTIAKNIFGANADRYKQMAQGLSPTQMNDLMMKFQSLPPEKRQGFLNEMQNEVNKIKNSNGSPAPTGIKPNFRY